ncbi:PDZ and LIM domain protein 3 isoform X8 [Homalodisca vitripennis]|uniref:PDZ and LIM domain protein 3 isoform X8 n=1 Tax=Homalodisca vitripennis TaxID=197043 RepID=UPI001EEC554B|nr:PDZ and LIM domain protein 3 isoform X8 [Homalodisca vitripennis]
MGEFHLRTFTVTINRRNTHTAWGISIAGGCDQGSPLVITKVQPGSPAEGVVQRGDLVRKVADYDSRDVRHQDVQTLFKNSGNSIKLVVSRETRGSAPHSAPGSRAGSVPPLPTAVGSAKGTDSPYIMASLNPALIDHPRQRTASPHRAELEEEIQMVTEQPYRTTPLVLPGAKIKKDALPTESYLRHHPNPLMRAPPPLHGLPHEVLMKQKVMPQFNSPIGLYSEDNIVNTIQQQTGATPYKKTVVYDPAKSETYKALKESEFGDTLQEIPTPVEPKVFSPAKVNTKNLPPPKTRTTPHRSVAAHSVPGPMHNINSIGASAENIQQSNTFKRLMHMVLEEENY